MTVDRDDENLSSRSSRFEGNGLGKSQAVWATIVCTLSSK